MWLQPLMILLTGLRVGPSLPPGRPDEIGRSSPLADVSRSRIVEPGGIAVQDHLSETFLPEIGIIHQGCRDLLAQLVLENGKGEVAVDGLKDRRRRLVEGILEIPFREDPAQGFRVLVCQERPGHDGSDVPGHEIQGIPLEAPMVVRPFRRRVVEQFTEAPVAEGRRGVGAVMVGVVLVHGIVVAGPHPPPGRIVALGHAFKRNPSLPVVADND